MKQRDPEISNSISNRLLAALSPVEYRRIKPKLVLVPLTFGNELYQVGALISHVYFPNSGIISILAAVERSSTLEVGLIGREGMAGLPLFLGVKTSNVKAIVQGTGTAMRLAAADLDRETACNGSLARMLRRFTHSMITQISQSSVCFRFHAIELRLARWLLMTSDRTESSEFQMTQEFLSHMLGVRREAVSRAADSLEKRKLITHKRGSISIIDRRGLERIACQCYEIVRNEESDIFT